MTRRRWALPAGAQFALPAVLIGITVITAVANNRFLSFGNLSNLLLQISVLGVLAAGQTLLVASGGMDLSVGASLSVSALVAGLVIQATGSTWLGVIAAVLAGAVIGLVNGGLVALNRAHPFIITLGTMTLLQGVAIVISNGSPINGMGGLYQLFGVDSWAGLPVPVYALLLAILVGQFVLRNTILGRYALAIGGNEEASRLAGVPVGPIKVLLYTVNGLFVGVSAFVLGGILDSALPSMGTGYELQAIAAVVIGGTALSGGRGTVLGTFAGVLLLGLVSNAVNLIGVGANFQSLILGSIIVAAVMFQPRSGK